uniref:RNA helicase n=1 Tax=Strongyloides stercoralis TaxID=6248 RepID=A0A0K0DZZ4_STRER
MKGNKLLPSPLPTINEEADETNNNNDSLPTFSPLLENMSSSRTMGTGIIRGNGNNLQSLSKLKPTNSLFGRNQNSGTEKIPTTKQKVTRKEEGDTKQPYNSPKAPQKNSNNKYEFFTPIDRPCSVIFEEARRNAEWYSHLDEIDDNIVISGLNDVIDCFDKWEDANFHPTLLKNIQMSGYIKPRKIQSYVMPIIMGGYDLLGQSETGSGKTGAFLLPIIDDMLKNNWQSKRRAPFALIIVPTRELAIQIHEQARKFCEGTEYGCAKIYGQISNVYLQWELDNGCDILVATPGRLLNYLKTARVNLRSIKYLVCDEADRLVEFNFINDVNQILQSSFCPPITERHNLLFSATYPGKLEDYCRGWIKKNAVTVKNEKFNEVNRNVTHSFINVDGINRNKLIADILIEEQKEAQKNDLPLRKTLIFVDRKKTSDMMAFLLLNYGIKVSSINGDRCQEDREQVINDFRSGKLDVLVATDVAARGIDICDLDHVIISELPADFTTYIHRIGRTGRVKRGEATVFYDPKKDYALANDLINMLQNANQPIPEFIKKI